MNSSPLFVRPVSLGFAGKSLLASIVIAATTLYSATAWAAIIGGQVKGVIDLDFLDGNGLIGTGDEFTFDFTYDSSQLTTEITVIEDEESEVGTVGIVVNTAKVLSGTLRSGNFFYSYLNPIGDVNLTDVFYGYNSSEYLPFLAYTGIDLRVNDVVYSQDESLSKTTSVSAIFGRNFFFGFDSFEAFLFQTDESGEPLILADSFTGNIVTEPIPSPALLPGIIGMGFALVRRHRDADVDNSKR